MRGPWQPFLYLPPNFKNSPSRYIHHHHHFSLYFNVFFFFCFHFLDTIFFLFLEIQLLPAPFFPTESFLAFRKCACTGLKHQQQTHTHTHTFYIYSVLIYKWLKGSLASGSAGRGWWQLPSRLVKGNTRFNGK